MASAAVQGWGRSALTSRHILVEHGDQSVVGLDTVLAPGGDGVEYKAAGVESDDDDDDDDVVVSARSQLTPRQRDYVPSEHATVVVAECPAKDAISSGDIIETDQEYVGETAAVDTSDIVHEPKARCSEIDSGAIKLNQFDRNYLNHLEKNADRDKISDIVPFDESEPVINTDVPVDRGHSNSATIGYSTTAEIHAVDTGVKEVAPTPKQCDAGQSSHQEVIYEQRPSPYGKEDSSSSGSLVVEKGTNVEEVEGATKPIGQSVESNHQPQIIPGKPKLPELSFTRLTNKLPPIPPIHTPEALVPNIEIGNSYHVSETSTQTSESECSENGERGYKSGNRSHSLTTVKSDDSSRYVRPSIASSEEEVEEGLDQVGNEFSDACPAYVKTVTAWLRSGKARKFSHRGHFSLNTSDSDIHIYQGTSPAPSPPASDRSLPIRTRGAAVRLTQVSHSPSGSADCHLEDQERYLSQLAPDVVTSSDAETEPKPKVDRPNRKPKVKRHSSLPIGNKTPRGRPSPRHPRYKRTQPFESKMSELPEVGRRRQSAMPPPPEDIFSMLHNVTVLPKFTKSPTGSATKAGPKAKTATTGTQSSLENGEPRRRQTRTISVASSEAEVITLPLSHVDFLPEQLGTLTYERFDVLVDHANDWLQVNTDCRALSLETIELERSGLDVGYLDSDQTLFHDSGSWRTRYMWGLRLWLVPKSIADPRKAQKLGYHNVFPSLVKRGDALHKHTYEDFDDVMANVNHTLKTKALGRVLNIQVVPLKVRDVSKGVDPDQTWWTALDKYGQEYIHLARIFYEKGAPQKLKIEYVDFVPREIRAGSLMADPVYEPFLTLMVRAHQWLEAQSQIRLVSMQSVNYKLKHGEVNTQQTVFHHAGIGATSLARVLRLFYMRPIEGGFVKSYTPTLSYRTFVPLQTQKAGLFKGPRFECLSDTIDRAAAWLYVTGVRALAVETVPVRMSGNQLPDPEVTLCQKESDVTSTWLHSIRIYLDGDFNEPDPDDLPPVPVVKHGTCVCTIL